MEGVWGRRRRRPQLRNFCDRSPLRRFFSSRRSLSGRFEHRTLSEVRADGKRGAVGLGTLRGFGISPWQRVQKRLGYPDAGPGGPSVRWLPQGGQAAPEEPGGAWSSPRPAARHSPGPAARARAQAEAVTRTLTHNPTRSHRLTLIHVHTLTHTLTRTPTQAHTLTYTHMHTHSHRLTH